MKLSADGVDDRLVCSTLALVNLRAYIRAGSVAAAAYELGISETTVRQHLSGLYRRMGCVNAAQAAYWLGTRQLDSDAAPRAASRGR
jgi:predicted ArsR family transcriptional regulator